MTCKSRVVGIEPYGGSTMCYLCLKSCQCCSANWNAVICITRTALESMKTIEMLLQSRYNPIFPLWNNHDSRTVVSAWNFLRSHHCLWDIVQCRRPSHQRYFDQISNAIKMYLSISSLASIISLIILHTLRQHNCLWMCKISLWLDKFPLNYRNRSSDRWSDGCMGRVITGCERDVPLQWSFYISILTFSLFLVLKSTLTF